MALQETTAGLRPKLSIEGVSVTFAGQGTSTQALAPVDLAIPAGRFVTLIGPSGCGKSTLFNVIAGLTSCTAGTIRVDGEDVTGFIGQVGYMLQKDLLLPWRTVLDNVALGMELRGMPMRIARQTALPYLHRYGLRGFEDKLPRTLSGGMRQRAALLRTLLTDTDIILLDEPFGALDAQTKHQMQEWLLQIWADFDKTVVFVTHDVEEAIYLSDEICVMTPRPGRIVERFERGTGPPTVAQRRHQCRLYRAKAALPQPAVRASLLDQRGGLVSEMHFLSVRRARDLRNGD